jgi:DNA-binding GntR family transcriptional regulator
MESEENMMAIAEELTSICRRLGVSRASLYRAFSALEDSGLIVRKGKSITIIDPAGLETVL